MKSLFFKLTLSIFFVSVSSGCYKRHSLYIPGASQSDNAPAGYVSEATCLRLISGQEMPKKEEVKKVSNDLCNCCNCAISNCKVSSCQNKNSESATNKINATYSSRPLPAKAKTVVSNVVKSVTVASKPSSVMASLNPKAVTQNLQTAQGKPTQGDSNVKKIQTALNQKGAKLDVDGIMGERTVRLLKAFQTMNDLPVTGKADKETAKFLGIAN